MRIEVDDADGPPPPPAVRRRRRRRNVAIGTTLVVIVAVPLVLGVMGSTGQVGTQDDPPAASDESGDEPADEPGDGSAEGSEDAPDRGGSLDADAGGDAGVEGDGSIDRLDSSQFDGTDGIFAELLGDIDASEHAMMSFQDDLSEAFAQAGGDSDRLAQTIRDAASTGQAQLEEVRSRMVDEVADERADAVRTIYLEHLDSWAEYMGAIEEDPSILRREGQTSVLILAINVTADAFARTLEDQMPADADAQVRRFADDILDRGFRGISEADV